MSIEYTNEISSLKMDFYTKVLCELKVNKKLIFILFYYFNISKIFIFLSLDEVIIFLKSDEKEIWFIELKCGLIDHLFFYLDEGL